ncbi:MAG: WG repeat-containing protein [Cyclobacteriaceae bacterium]
MVNKSLFVLFMLVVVCASSMAQISPERSAQTRMGKGKWVKAEQSIKKALRRDSVNAEAKLVYAQWYFSSGNPGYSIDSAYKYTLASLDDYSVADLREKEKMQRFPLDSMVLVRLREQIDSAAFERAKEYNSEGSYIAFLRRFTLARQRDNAVELRDEVSFLDALKENTYQSFDRYLKKYPNSHRFTDAKNRYEKLLFEDKTKDGKLKSYISFYKEYPSSPFRNLVLEEIFEITTASGEVRDYLDFMAQYQESKSLVKRARDIAFHIALQHNLEIGGVLLTDSIKRILNDDAYWVPVLKNGKFGFMDSNGDEKLAPQFDDILDEYLCGNVTDDFLVTSSGLVSRSNNLLLAGEVKAVDDLGFGVLIVYLKNCIRLVHKSGFMIVQDCAEDARIIAERFIAIRMDKKWTLHSFTGKKLVDEKFDDIQSEEGIIVFNKNGKRMLNTIEQVVTAADRNPLPDKMVFDEVRKLSSDKVLVKNGSLEGVVNSDLEFVIPLDRQVLTLTSFGFTKKVLNKVTTVGLSETIDKEEFSEIKPYLNWLGLYQVKKAKLYHQPSSKVIEEDLDSLWFTNRLAMAVKGDSMKVIFGSGRKMIFPKSTKVSFVKSPDSVRFFYLEEKNKKQLYEVDSGVKRFALEFDHIEGLGDDLFLIEYKSKKGIVGPDGKSILPVEYDAIIKSSGNVISLLKDKKFGLYDIRRKKLFKAQYDRNITFFSESTLIVFKDGFYGFVDNESSPISKFEFEEVRPWSDSSAMVRKNFRWMIYSVYDGKISNDQIKDYRLIKDTEQEKIAIIHKENEYGVMSNTRGVIIPATFSDLLNLGTAEKPFYFTEKNVEEAGIFVVIYYDENGQMIRRQIYESDEYDRIYCR